MRRPLVVSTLLLLLGACSFFAPSRPRYVVYFEQWSARLDEPARQVIAHAAESAKAFPKAPVVVTGFADPEGSAHANQDMSALRAQVVADGLVADGIAVDRISQRAEGSVGYALDSQESRRVEISVRMP